MLGDRGLGLAAVVHENRKQHEDTETGKAM